MEALHKPEPVKKKLNRRAGACEPCRKHKIRCSGGEVCDHCRNRKNKKNKEPCWYDPQHLASRKTKKARSKKASRTEMPSADEESDVDKSFDNESDSDAAQSEDLTPLYSSPADEQSTGDPHRGPPVTYPSDDHLGPYGMLGCINQFKKLSGASVDLVSSLAVVQCDSTEAFEMLSAEGMIEASELFKERHEHSLSYFISEAEIQKTSADIQQMAWRAINSKDYQLDKGRVNEASFWQPYLTKSYSAFTARRGGRVASTDEAELVVEQKVGKLIVDLEIRTKMHLGIPLEKEIKSGQIFLPAPTFCGSIDDALEGLEFSKSQYRQTAVIALDLLPDFDIMSSTIEQYDELVSVLKQLTEQQSAFVDVAGLIDDSNIFLPVVDHQIEHYSFAMMLACRLALYEKPKQPTNVEVDAIHDDDKKGDIAAVSETDIDGATVIQLCRRILQVFMVATSVVSIQDSHNWTRSYAAYSSAAMLAISCIQSSKPLAADKELVTKTVDYFRVATRELANNFSALASERLEKLYAELGRSPVDKSSFKTMKIKREASRPSSKKASSRVPSPDLGTKRKRNTKVSSTPSSTKRQRVETQATHQDLPATILEYGQHVIDVGAFVNADAPVYGTHLEAANYEDEYGYSGPPSANTSFDGAAPLDTPLYSRPYDPQLVAAYQGNSMPMGLYEYPQDWHPPIRMPWPPLEPFWFENDANPAAAYASHYNARVMAAHAAGGNFTRPSGYGASPVTAQMKSHRLVSPHGPVQRTPWPGNEDAAGWSAQPHIDTRRSSDAFSVDQQRGYGWEASSGQHMMAQVGPQAQNQHGMSNTATEMMGRENSHMGNQHVAMTTGGEWRNPENGAYDGGALGG